MKLQTFPVKPVNGVLQPGVHLRPDHITGVLSAQDDKGNFIKDQCVLIAFGMQFLVAGDPASMKDRVNVMIEFEGQPELPTTEAPTN